MEILIDDADRELYESRRWYISAHGYARCTRTDEYLHRIVAGCQPRDGLVVDHINRNKLDNRRANLRVGTQSDNMQNVAAHRDSTSKHRGVSWSKHNKGWMAQAMRQGVRKHLGTFKTEGEAAAAVERFWNG